MMKHLSNSELQGFLKREMPASELIAADDHLAACADCRAALEATVETTGLPADLEGLANAPESHLEFEQVRSLADGEPVSAEVAAHAASCRMCAREVQELKGFAVSLDAIPRSPGRANIKSMSHGHRWRRHPGWYALAAAILLAAVVGIHWKLSAGPSSHGDTVASVHDGGGLISLDAAGQLQGTERLPAADRDALASAMRTGRLEISLPASFIGQEPETMLGAPEAAAAFNVVSPVGEVLISDQPDFEWQPMAGANAYRVTVYGAGYHKVAESPTVQETRWHSTASLPRDGIYTWTVTAQTSHGAVRVPAPPEPEATFKVMSENAAAGLNSAAQAHAGDHLLLAVLYSHAGAVDEASSQLDLLAAENPGSKLVDGLRASLAQSKYAPQAPSPIRTNAAQ